MTPRVDIYETDSGYVLLADMPGVKAQGLDVVAERNEAQHPWPRRAAGTANHDYKEFELANYERSFRSHRRPRDVEGVSATLRDGVLRVDIPKSARVQPKKIPVRTE